MFLCIISLFKGRRYQTVRRAMPPGLVATAGPADRLQPGRRWAARLSDVTQMTATTSPIGGEISGYFDLHLATPAR
jgi:hypothetical protein